MEKKTIGSFLSALRKSNGLTQQEVANKLNVSNKTVSKWERDESCPDIALIPVIAELFGTTCDEILLGERITKSEMPPNKANKSEKQLKWIVSSIKTKSENAFYISLLITIIGIILLYSISYAFNSPIIGFGLNMIAITVSIIISVIQLNKSNLMLNSEDFTEEDSNFFKVQMASIFKLLFITLSINTASLMLSLPLILAGDTDIAESVSDFGRYLLLLPFMVVLTLIIIACLYYFLHKKINVVQYDKYLFSKIKHIRLINILQCIFILVTFLIPIFDYFGLDDSSNNSFIRLVILFAPLIFMLIIIICFSIKAETKVARLYILSSGIRNIIYVLSVIMILSCYKETTYPIYPQEEIVQIMDESENVLNNVAYAHVASEQTFKASYLFGGIFLIILTTIIFSKIKNKLKNTSTLNKTQL